MIKTIIVTHFGPIYVSLQFILNLDLFLNVLRKHVKLWLFFFFKNKDRSSVISYKKIVAQLIEENRAKT